MRRQSTAYVSQRKKRKLSRLRERTFIASANGEGEEDEAESRESSLSRNISQPIRNVLRISLARYCVLAVMEGNLSRDQFLTRVYVSRSPPRYLRARMLLRGAALSHAGYRGVRVGREGGSREEREGGKREEYEDPEGEEEKRRRGGRRRGGREGRGRRKKIDLKKNPGLEGSRLRGSCVNFSEFP